MVTSRILATFVTVVVLSGLARAENPKEKPAKPDLKEDKRLSRKTPEGTLRRFALGVLFRNEELIKETILPVGDEDLRILLTKTKGAETNIQKLTEICARMKVRALKPGDKFILPGGQTVVVAEEEVNDKRMVLVLEDSPVPTRMYKVKGHWRVDAAPVIAGRKAAREAKRKGK